jgi:prepilin-type N-terminal cleavage/methylation domain-containing protein
MSRGPRPTAGRNHRHAAAFTLIELLTVIAIIAILAAILIPTVSGARRSANRARTRVQFAQWADAIESFREEYGCYPVFAGTCKVNDSAGILAGTVHLFHDVLAGHRRDGTALPASAPGLPADPAAPEAQNFRRIRFVTFTANDLFSDAGDDDASGNLIHDGFENTDIAVLVDRNTDGVINAVDYPVLPGVSPPGDSSLRLTPATVDFPDGPSGGIRAGVLFYSCPPGTTDASGLIMSWK